MCELNFKLGQREQRLELGDPSCSRSLGSGGVEEVSVGSEVEGDRKQESGRVSDAAEGAAFDVEVKQAKFAGRIITCLNCFVYLDFLH